MKNNVMHRHPKVQHHRDPNEEFCASEYQLVKDGRLYGTILLTCDGSDAFKHEGENPINAIHLRHNHAYTRESEYSREQIPRRDSYAEDINTEAEKFIQMEHQKFNILLNNRTWSSG